VACSSRQLGWESPACTSVLGRPAGLAGCGHAWRSRRDRAPCRGNSGTAGIMPGRHAGVAEAAPAAALGSGWWLGVGTEAARSTVRTDRAAGWRCRARRKRRHCGGDDSGRVGVQRYEEGADVKWTQEEAVWRTASPGVEGRSHSGTAVLTTSDSSRSYSGRIPSAWWSSRLS
jgi:hypothetical protein